MTWIPYFLSSLAIIISIGSLIIAGLRLDVAQNAANVAQNAADQAKLSAQGTLELTLRQSISNSRNRVEDIGIRLEEFKLNHAERDDSVLVRSVNSALEDNLNAYEKGCTLYLDNKIDKDRFFKDFRTEIRQLVENKNCNERYLHPTTSKFKAILKVYDLWENHEK
jgi:type II secretory pathway pseudopilin PulG